MRRRAERRLLMEPERSPGEEPGGGEVHRGPEQEGCDRWGARDEEEGDDRSILQGISRDKPKKTDVLH